MPSLLNFDPLLNTYDPNAGQEDIRQGMREAAGYISRGIEIAGQRGREREDKFESVFDVDISKVTDLESKKYLVGEYEKLKRSYVDKFAKNKNWLGYGKLSPVEKIDLRGDMDSLKNTAETLRVLDQSLVSATDPKNKKWGYEVDEESKKEYSEAKNSGDVSKMAYLLQKVGKSETGIPFVNFKSVDPNSYINSQVGEIRKSIDSSTEIMKKQKEVGGTTYDESTTLKKFGTPEDARATTYNVISKGEAAPVIEANLMKGSYLTDDEKRLAVESSEQFPLLKYFVDQRANVAPIIADQLVSHSLSERPTKEKSKSSSTAKEKTFYKVQTDDGEEWNWGANPLRYDGELEVDGESITVSGVSNTGISKKNGKYFAKFQIPRDPKVEKSKLNDKIDKEVSDKYSEEVKNITGIGIGRKTELRAKIRTEIEDKYQTQLEDNSKKMYVEVPLRDVYNELSPKLEYNKMVLDGFNPDWQNENQNDKPKKTSKNSTYKLKSGVEVTRQELLDAGWTEDDINKL